MVDRLQSFVPRPVGHCLHPLSKAPCLGQYSSPRGGVSSTPIGHPGRSAGDSIAALPPAPQPSRSRSVRSNPAAGHRERRNARRPPSVSGRLPRPMLACRVTSACGRRLLRFLIQRQERVWGYRPAAQIGPADTRRRPESATQMLGDRSDRSPEGLARSTGRSSIGGEKSIDCGKTGLFCRRPRHRHELSWRYRCPSFY